MARYSGPVCKLCRREGMKLFLKGDRCYTEKCQIERHNYPPGEHGRRHSKESPYAVQLREKQRAKRYYGILEKQFKGYYELAVRQKGITGENLLRILESRLDNVIYRSGIAFSRAEARQMVRHGHFTVNGRRVTIPSYRVRSGDEVGLSSSGRKAPRIAEAIQVGPRAEIPTWLEVDIEKRSVKVVDLPSRDQIDAPVAEQLIVELYSK